MKIFFFIFFLLLGGFQGLNFNLSKLPKYHMVVKNTTLISIPGTFAGIVEIQIFKQRIRAVAIVTYHLEGCCPQKAVKRRALNRNSLAL